MIRTRRTGSRRRFTQHERDEGTQLDYMVARYAANESGRFLAVDPVSGSADRPSNWNRYSYAANNPVRFIDPNGEEVVDSWLRTSGANLISRPSIDPSTSITRAAAATLGPKETATALAFAANVVFQVAPGDSPDNYRIRQDAVTFDLLTKAFNPGPGGDPGGPKGNDSPGRRNQGAVSSETVASWDTPGWKADTANRQVRADATVSISVILKTWAVDKATGKSSGGAVYWQVDVTTSPGSTPKIAATAISMSAYLDWLKRAGVASP